MADWRTYAKAARDTARKQAPQARRAAARSVVGAERAARDAGDRARRGAARTYAAREPEVRRRIEEGRRTARAVGVAGGNAARRVSLGTRIKHALRDVLITVASVLVIALVLRFFGIMLPSTALWVVCGLVAVVRIGLIFGRQSRQDEAAQEAVRQARADDEHRVREGRGREPGKG